MSRGGSREPIESRALEWRVLQPGESLQIGTRDEHYKYSSSYKGSFEFWADYAPLPSRKRIEPG